VRRRRPPRAGAITELPPLKILTQIFLLQIIWYFSATILILFSALVAGKKFSTDMILSWRTLRGDTTVGWTLGLCWMLNSFVGYVHTLDHGGTDATRTRRLPEGGCADIVLAE
jgi:hypothetical protein